MSLFFDQVKKRKSNQWKFWSILSIYYFSWVRKKRHVNEFRVFFWYVKIWLYHLHKRERIFYTIEIIDQFDVKRKLNYFWISWQLRWSFFTFYDLQQWVCVDRKNARVIDKKTSSNQWRKCINNFVSRRWSRFVTITNKRSIV